MTHGTDPASATTPIPLDGDGEELIGVTIDGRYKLEGTLGRGGMGLVYRASQLGLRRPVAVKILHPGLAASPDVRSRFEREALAVGKIDHPNCVAVYDVGRLPDGALYLAMELLEGRSLSEVLEQEGQLAPGRALHILSHILRGLAHVHESGLIHRDMKPENIFLVRQGDDVDFAKILDFGIAKPMKGELSDDGVKLTQAGMAFGTPIYMAPEQALGNPLDGRADLYAAAIMAYEMLCGQPPFYSDDKLEVMSMHTARPVPPMRQRLIKNARPVPSSIEKLIVRGLTKKPGDRYASAEIFLAKVEHALETPDGGQTDVNFERPSSTGSQPLVSASGRLTFDDELDVGASPDGQDVTNFIERTRLTAPPSIGDAIDEVLAAPPPTLAPVVPAAPPGRPRAATAQGAMGPGGPPVPARRPPTQPPPAPRPRLESPRAALGGVGLGLPYTGPSGEPIFGLTPEQRLAQAIPPPGRAPGVTSPAGGTRAARPRWPLYAGLLGAAIVVGVVIAVATTARGTADDAGLDPASPAGVAQALLDSGRTRQAIAHLEAHAAAIGTDPRGQLVLGRAYATMNDRAAALTAYEHALALAPQLETDPHMRASLFAMTEPNPKVTDLGPLARAFELWLGKTTDPSARPALAANAVSDNIARRRAVRPVIDRFKLNEQIDWLTAYSLDLDEEPVCEKRRGVVAQLRGLSDRRAIPALERALVKRGKVGVTKNKPVNACLADDARQAIAFLKGLPK